MMHPLQNGECLVNLQEFEGAACPPPLLLCFAVVDVSLVLSHRLLCEVFWCHFHAWHAYIRQSPGRLSEHTLLALPILCVRLTKCIVTHYSLQTPGIPTKACSGSFLGA